MITSRSFSYFGILLIIFLKIGYKNIFIIDFIINNKDLIKLNAIYFQPAFYLFFYIYFYLNLGFAFEGLVYELIFNDLKGKIKFN